MLRVDRIRLELREIFCTIRVCVGKLKMHSNVIVAVRSEQYRGLLAGYAYNKHVLLIESISIKRLLLFDLFDDEKDAC